VSGGAAAAKVVVARRVAVRHASDRQLRTER